MWPMVAKTAASFAGSKMASKAKDQLLDTGENKNPNIEAQNVNTGQGNGVQVSKGDDGWGHGGSLMQTLGAGIMGGGAAGLKAWKETGSFKEAMKDGALGAGAGALGKMSYDAIQEKGGGLKAGITGAASSALASKIDPDGPGMGVAAMTGFGGATMGNLMHDKATESGHKGLGDFAGGAGLGAGIGYGYDGNKGAMFGGVGGAALGGLDTMLGNMNSQDINISKSGPAVDGVSYQQPQVGAGGDQPSADQPQMDNDHAMGFA